MVSATALTDRMIEVCIFVSSCVARWSAAGIRRSQRVSTPTRDATVRMQLDATMALDAGPERARRGNIDFRARGRRDIASPRPLLPILVAFTANTVGGGQPFRWRH
jgi:hypothetical protein